MLSQVVTHSCCLSVSVACPRVGDHSIWRATGPRDLLTAGGQGGVPLPGPRCRATGLAKGPPLPPARLRRLCQRALRRPRPQAGPLQARAEGSSAAGTVAGLLSAWAAWGLRPQSVLARRLLAGSEERVSRGRVLGGAPLARWHSGASAATEEGAAAMASAGWEAGDVADEVRTLVLL